MQTLKNVTLVLFSSHCHHVSGVSTGVQKPINLVKSIPVVLGQFAVQLISLLIPGGDHWYSFIRFLCLMCSPALGSKFLTCFFYYV